MSISFRHLFFPFIYLISLVSFTGCAFVDDVIKELQPPEGYVQVVRVVDGDTIVVSSGLGAEEETVRLIGIDTPETKKPNTPVQCFGKEATHKMEELVTGENVRLEEDTTQSSRDRYGRMLKYIYLEDGTFVNQRLIEDGYAYEYTYDDPYKYQQEFRAAEQHAKEAQKGLWAPQSCNGKR